MKVPEKVTRLGNSGLVGSKAPVVGGPLLRGLGSRCARGNRNLMLSLLKMKISFLVGNTSPGPPCRYGH